MHTYLLVLPKTILLLQYLSGRVKLKTFFSSKYVSSKRCVLESGEDTVEPKITKKILTSLLEQSTVCR